MYLCTVFQIIRKYAPMLLIVMMSLMAVALAVDEYNDSRRIAEDLRIETCMELETEDYEWDESDLSNQPAFNLTPTTPDIVGDSPLVGIRERGFISDKQRLGLVRRYAPRKALVCYNYALT